MKLLDNLKQFTGTEQYHRITLGKLVVTDGIKYLVDKAQCHWLMDIVESYQHKLKEVPFQIWCLKVNEDDSAVVTCKEDSDQPNLVKQEIGYTDFPLDEIEFYCIDGVILLKTEY